MFLSSLYCPWWNRIKRGTHSDSPDQQNPPDMAWCLLDTSESANEHHTTDVQTNSSKPSLVDGCSTDFSAVEVKV